MLRIDSRSASYFRVLIAEDDARFRVMLEDALTIFGFRKLTFVETGKEALEMIEAYRNGFRYDFIITDWEMPDMQGIELLENIRQSTELPDFSIPILLCTGMAQKRHVIGSRDLGCTEFLAKPFTIEQLAGKIQALLSRPRNFIICDRFIGPDRRRQDITLPDGQIERRRAA